MTLDQHIAELRAELDGCILSRRERAQISTELEAALAERTRRTGETAISECEEVSA